MQKYHDMDATELSRSVRGGDFTPADTARIAVDTMRKLGRLNAVVEVYDNISIGKQTGLLAGVPMVRKDLDCEEQGRLTEWCSPLARGFVAEKDSFFLGRLKDAGAMVVGRSTTPELGSAITTESWTYGPTLNPFALSRNAGGSSGGSAALVASGAVPIGHGSDAAGSLRIPAAWCGLCTLKPTRGRISQAPEGPNLFGLSENFVLTKSIRDLRLIYRLLEHAVEGEFYDFKRSTTSSYGRNEFSIGLIDYNLGDIGVDNEYLACATKAAKEIEKLGFSVDRAKINFDFDEYVDFILVRFAYTLAWHANKLAERFDDQKRIWESVHPMVRAWKEYGEKIPRNAVFRAIELQNSICRKIGSWFGKFDFLIAPVTAQTPPLNGEFVYENVTAQDIPEINRKYENHIQFCGPTNVSGHPSVVFPFGVHSNGTPIGIQLIGRMDSTETILDLAEAVFPKIAMRAENVDEIMRSKTI